MEKICNFYNTPTGCDRGNSCGFFHLTEAALERVTVAKRINTHAYSHLCTSSVLGTCRKPNCEYLQPQKDDSRYKSSIIYRREVFDDNRFLSAKSKLWRRKQRIWDPVRRKTENISTVWESRERNCDATWTDWRKSQTNIWIASVTWANRASDCCTRRERQDPTTGIFAGKYAGSRRITATALKTFPEKIPSSPGGTWIPSTLVMTMTMEARMTLSRPTPTSSPWDCL